MTASVNEVKSVKCCEETADGTCEGGEECEVLLRNSSVMAPVKEVKSVKCCEETA